MQNTRRVYRYSKSIETVDKKTGEIEKAVIVRQQKQDLNFVKIFLPERGYFMYPPEMISSARAIMDYLLVVMGKDNVAVAPTTEIKERIDLSEPSICRGRKQLLELNFIRQRGQGIFMVNPSKHCKVDGEKRAELYAIYEELRG